MGDREMFKIGEVAKMFHISVGTLRHYERAGLLKPEYIDDVTGYRYYSVGQFEPLTTIRYLRALDMPLEQIGDFLQNRDLDVIEEKLVHQKELIAAKEQELENIRRKIERRIFQLRDARSSELGTIRLVRLPSCRVVPLQDNLQWRSYLFLEESIRRLEKNQQVPTAFLGKVGVGILEENLVSGRYNSYDVVFLILDDEDDYVGNVELQPEGFWVTVRFTGSHGEAPFFYAEIMNYINKNEFTVSGSSREITLIDNAFTNNPAEFVTEISVPVRLN